MRRHLRVITSILSAVIAVSLLACGPSSAVPKRRVVEGDIGRWWFRRYQHVRDIEVLVPNNPAVAHTAVYARDEAVKGARVSEADVAVAFVTEYKTRKGVAEALAKAAQTLANDEGYSVAKRTLAGKKVFLVTAGDEAWAFWSAGRYVVKIGGRGVRSVPEGLVSRYAAIYR